MALRRTTDRHTASKLLRDVAKKYPEAIHMKLRQIRVMEKVLEDHLRIEEELFVLSKFEAQ